METLDDNVHIGHFNSDLNETEKNKIIFNSHLSRVAKNLFLGFPTRSSIKQGFTATEDGSKLEISD